MLSCLGFVASACVPRLWLLYITYGVMTGMFMPMSSYTCRVLCGGVGKWVLLFQKRLLYMYEYMLFGA